MKRLSRLILVVWIGVVLLIGATALGKHLATLPMPDRDSATLAAALTALGPPASNGRDATTWTALHFLYGGCLCSAKVRAHLLARGPQAGVRERIISIGASDPDDERLRHAGFEVEQQTPVDVKQRWGVEVAPLLVIADASDHVRWVGSYTDRKQSPVLRDVETLVALQRGERVAARPVYGCPMSDELRRKADPLGLRL